MQVKVLLFAQARQIADADSVSIEMKNESTVGELRHAVAQQFPDLAALVSRSSFSVQHQYAIDTDVIPSGAEIALIPPVSGG